MQKYKSNIITTTGLAQRNVSVRVLDDNGALATLYADRYGQTPIANPQVTAVDGTFAFYAANGRYSLQITINGVTYTDQDVVLAADPEDMLVAGPIADAVNNATASVLATATNAASAAQASQNAAAGSQGAAAASESNAAGSASAAAGSAATASGAAGAASASEANAHASENAAATSAGNAATSESNALASKNAAATAAANAATYAQGYANGGVYGAGITLNDRFTFVAKDNELYRLADAVALPYTTTGDWAGESAKFVTIGDRVLRQELTDTSDPAKGASLIPTVPRVAASIAELTTLPANPGRVVSVCAFYAGSIGGGGLFAWDSTRAKSDANGGTVVDPTKTGGFDGTASTLAAYLAAQGTGAGNGCWVRAHAVALDPAMFGATDASAPATDAAVTACVAACIAANLTFTTGDARILVSRPIVVPLAINIKDVRITVESSFSGGYVLDIGDPARAQAIELFTIKGVDIYGASKPVVALHLWQCNKVHLADFRTHECGSGGIFIDGGFEVNAVDVLCYGTQQIATPGDTYGITVAASDCMFTNVIAAFYAFGVIAQGGDIRVVNSHVWAGSTYYPNGTKMYVGFKISGASCVFQSTVADTIALKNYAQLASPSNGGIGWWLTTDSSDCSIRDAQFITGNDIPAGALSGCMAPVFIESFSNVIDHVVAGGFNTDVLPNDYVWFGVLTRLLYNTLRDSHTAWDKSEINTTLDVSMKLTTTNGDAGLSGWGGWAKYRREGNVIHLQALVSVTVGAGASGNIIITGLPVPAVSRGSFYATLINIFAVGVNNSGVAFGLVPDSNRSTIALVKPGGDPLATSDVVPVFAAYITATYIASDL